MASSSCAIKRFGAIGVSFRAEQGFLFLFCASTFVCYYLPYTTQAMAGRVSIFLGQPYYVNGDLLAGSVVVDASHTLTVHEIVLEIEGKEAAFWEGMADGYLTNSSPIVCSMV